MKTLKNTLIELSSIQYRYPLSKQKSIKNLNLSIIEGDIIFLIGSNGAGKSTLLKILCGLIKPDEGIIKANSKIINKDELIKIFNWGYIPQNLGLIGHLSVKKNILLGLLGAGNRYQFIHSVEDYEKAQIILSEYDLSNLKDRKINQLSGGERQRVAIARAFIREPNVIIADEIVSNLDQINGNKIIETIYYASKLAKVTTVIALHRIELSFRYPGKVLLLKNGEKIIYRDNTKIKINHIMKLLN